MTSLKTLTTLAFVASVSAHGYMSGPASRTALSFKAGIDPHPEYVILEQSSYGWPNIATTDVDQTGPCGYNKNGNYEYNAPGKAWGTAPIATYAVGDIVTTQMCVDGNGDHGGMFSYRICQDQAIVDKFTTVGYTPTLAEKEQAELCFQNGTLPCTDVPGQTCDYSPDCSAGSAACHRNDWFTCNAFEGTKCHGVDNSSLGACPTGTAGGWTVTKKIKIPNYVSSHTLLSWRWSSFQTAQVYLGCVDITITGAGGATSGSSGSSSNSSTPVTVPGNSTAPPFPAPGNSTESSLSSVSILAPSSVAAPSSAPTTLVTSAISSALTSSSGSSSGSSSSNCTINFSETVAPSSGETIKIAGSIASLGSWNPTSAPSLTSSGSTYTYSASLAPGTDIEYKYVKMSSSGTPVWEGGDNRKFTVPASCSSAVAVSDTWQ